MVAGAYGTSIFLLGTTIYGCIRYIPSNVECINFVILDSFGDGLNYGDGGYIICWNNKYWKSPSFGNYGASESLIICPSKFNQTETLIVFVQFEDDDSLQFLQFLDNIFISLMDNTIGYNVVFDIENESIADNTTCLDCKYGYCLCDVSINITMENIIAALCYLSSPELTNMYNYTWQDVWSNNIDFDDNTTINDFCINDVQILLDNNYIMVQQFGSISTPAFYINSQSTPIIIAVSPYLDIISIAGIYSNCNLYLELYDIIDPICNSLITAGVQATLCQSINCHSSYCNTTQALLSIGSDIINGYQILNYIPYRLNDDIYGLTECFNGTVIQQELINNTIPILAVNLNSCNYIDTISIFQDFGARAVVMVNISTPSSLTYTHWLPFNCDIQFVQSTTNSSAIFLSVVSQIDAQIATVFETNIRGNTSYGGSHSILYRFEVNTTYKDF